MKSRTKTVCKEITPGGSKICEKPKPGAQKCKPTEYNSADNDCKDKSAEGDNVKGVSKNIQNCFQFSVLLVLTALVKSLNQSVKNLLKLEKKLALTPRQACARKVAKKENFVRLTMFVEMVSQ